MNDPSYIGDGNPGFLGGGTYTGQSTDSFISDQAEFFGPAAFNIRRDEQGQRRNQRNHLPDVLHGSNNFIADRIDGLITDATNSPFTTVILPYMYIEYPDKQLKWYTMSYDEGLATRVPYEASARVLTQTRESFKASMKRSGVAIRLEHNFMASPMGRKDLSNQLLQMVGTIQYTNDLEVHIALITAPSYAKKWAEKYQSLDKTSAQICREYIDLFGFMQKNPNALDIMIEEAKSVLALWGSPAPNFLMCNSKLTFQMQMNPDRTNYITQGPDGVRRLAEGPNLSTYRGLRVINTRAFSMETGAQPRDVLRRRVRVAEYYRIPPQGARVDWEVQLYDESRDTFFTLKREDLNRMATLDPPAALAQETPPDQTITLQEYMNNGADVNLCVHIAHPNVRNPEATLVKPAAIAIESGLSEDWDLFQTNLSNYQNQIYDRNHLRRHHYRTVLDGLNVPILRPNAHTVYQPLRAHLEPIQACTWVYAHTALLENAATFLWTKVPVSEELMREGVLPFLYPGAPLARATAAWTATREMPMCPYQSLMIIAQVANLHPSNNIRQQLQATLRAVRVSISGLRAMATRFARAVLQPRHNQAPRTRIEMGRLLEECVLQAFRPTIAGGSDSQLIYDQWPDEIQDGAPIYHWAGVSETHGLLSDPAIETAYETHPNFRWNNIPQVAYELGDINEPQALTAFLHVMLQRFFTQNPDVFPDRIPYLAISQDDEDDYEYVIVRPCIEHSMLSVIMGRGGGPDVLGAMLWGQTELSCYDDSMYGVWGLSYKYHSRALVFNERNLIRVWDVCYDGYNGGKDDSSVKWYEESPGMDRPFNAAVTDMTTPYTGPSLMVMRFKVDRNNRNYRPNWPSPIVFHDKNLGAEEPPRLSPDPESIYVVQDANMRVFNDDTYREQYRAYLNRMPDFSYLHLTRKAPGQASVDMETSSNSLAFQGTYRLRFRDGTRPTEEINGSGHHGPDFVGCATIRSGKGTKPMAAAPQLMRMV